MRKALFYFLCVMVGSNLFAWDTVPDWENPEVFAVNKEDTRTTCLPYPDEELALADEAEASPYYQVLDGVWKFHWVGKPSEKPDDFYKEGYDVSGWADLKVPSTWEFNGYGIPVYLNHRYPFPKNPPISKVFREIGYADELGSGMRNTNKYTKLYSGGTPVFLEDNIFEIVIPMESVASLQVGPGEFYKVTERVTDRVTDRVTEKEQEILALLLENAGYTMPQLAEKLKISRKTVAMRLKSLKEKSVIERVGSDRKGYWKIN